MTISREPWGTPFPILNHFIVPCMILTVASWPAYRFLRSQVRWSGIPISLRIFHSLLWSTQSEALKWRSEVTQSCPTLCNPMDYSLPGSSIHGIFQASILEWVAISSSRRSSWPRDWTQVSRIVGRCFIVWSTREVNEAEVDAFLEFSCFPSNPADVANWISGSSAFSKSSLYSGKLTSH